MPHVAGSIWPETEPVGTRLPAGAHTTFSRFPPNAVPRRAVRARAASAAILCFTGVQDTGGHSAGGLPHSGKDGLGRGLREGDGASSKIRTSARASDGGSGWGLRGWGFPRSAQGLMADATVSPLGGGGRHGAAQGDGRREGPRSPRDALRRRFPPRLSSETPVTGITERTRRPVSSLPGRTAQNLRRPYRFLSTDFCSLLHARTSLGHVFA